MLGLCALMVGVGWAQGNSSATSNNNNSATSDRGAISKNKSDIAKRVDASARVLNEIMGTPDKAIPDKVMSNA